MVSQLFRPVDIYEDFRFIVPIADIVTKDKLRATRFAQNILSNVFYRGDRLFLSPLNVMPVSLLIQENDQRVYMSYNSKEEIPTLVGGTTSTLQYPTTARCLRKRRSMMAPHQATILYTDMVER
jgi:hypothetical protein